MKKIKSGRGFQLITHPAYLPQNQIDPDGERVIQESSAIGNYEDSMNNPGSSFLWVGDKHHLNREEVKELIDHMETWLITGRL